MDLSNAISQERCNIGAKLVSITNKEVAYELSIGTKLGTLDDLERRNSPSGCVISPNSVAFETDYVKVVEDTPILSAAEM